MQAAFSSRAGTSWLINASPDIRFQIESSPRLWPSAAKGSRNSPISGILLLSAELDQTLGLLLLREFQPLTVYSTRLVRQILEANSFFRMLTRAPDQLTWIEITPGAGFVLDETIHCTPIALPGEPPFYARERGTAEPGQATLGLLVECDSIRIAYTPSIPAVSDELRAVYASCDFIFADGTFWSDAELSAVHPGAPMARTIGHVPVGGEDGLLTALDGFWPGDAGRTRNLPRKILVHINNTNPLLDEESDERAFVLKAGWEVGYDGWQLSR